MAGALLTAFGVAALAACSGRETESEPAGPEVVGRTGSAATGTTFRWADTMADLKATIGSTTSPAIILAGYTSPGDGGGGIFFWDPSSSTGDDGGIIIVPTGSTTGRWRRVFDGPISVKWFGARGDGSNTPTPDHSAIQAAITAASTVENRGRAVYFPPGKYWCGATLTVQADGLWLLGGGGPASYQTVANQGNDSKGAVLINGTGGSPGGALVAFSGCSGAGMRGFLLHMVGTSNAKYTVTIDNCYNCTLEHVRIEQVYNGIDVYRSTGTRLTDIELRRLSGPRGITYRGAAPPETSHSLFVTRVVADTAGVANTSVDWITMSDYAYSIQILDSHLINGGRGFVMDAASRDARPKFAVVCNLNTDHTSGSGISIGRAEDVRIVNSWIGSDLTSNGITINSTFVREFCVENSRISGNRQHGILINGGEGIHIKNCAIGNNSAAPSSAGAYHGIVVASYLTHFYIVGNNFRGQIYIVGNDDTQNTQGYAVFVYTGCAKYVVAHNDFSNQYLKQYVPPYNYDWKVLNGSQYIDAHNLPV
jgi:hypothetical protein